jgi:drug/metabolite transporter (DMT)-like permease
MAGSVVLAEAPREPALPQSARHTQVPLRGIGLIVASTVFFSGGDVIAKKLAGSLPPIEITWLRYVMFALIMTPFVWRSSSGLGLRSHRPGL